MSRTHFITGYFYHVNLFSKSEQWQMTGKTPKWGETAEAKRAAVCWLSCWNDMPGQWLAEPWCQPAKHLLAASVESSREFIFHAFFSFFFAVILFAFLPWRPCWVKHSESLAHFTSHPSYSSTTCSLQEKCHTIDVLSQPGGVWCRDWGCLRLENQALGWKPSGPWGDWWDWVRLSDCLTWVVLC